MTTSGVTVNDPVRDIIVNRALRLVGAYSTMSGEPKANQKIDAIAALNMMLKSWQIQGFLWVKEFKEITLIQGQNSYVLGPADEIGYKPTRIFSAVRKDTNGYEIPLQSLSRTDWIDQVNKSNQGRITQYYYDPQKSTGTLYVWPSPDASGDVLVLDVDRPLELMVDADNTYDFPDEWMETVCYGLAVRLAPEYAVPLNERQLLEQEFIALSQNLMSYNMDYTSTFLGVEYHG